MSCKKKSGNTDYKDRYDGRGLRLEKIGKHGSYEH